MQYQILLIKPFVPIPNQSIDVPLGILSLSAYVKKEFGSQVSVSCIDLRVYPSPLKILQTVLCQRQFHLVGISMLSFEQVFLYDALPVIHNYAPNAQIVIGGPFATSQYSEALRYPGINCVVMGEGEQILCELVDRFMNNQSIDNVAGIAFQKNDTIICNSRQSYIQDLDRLPLLNYNHLYLKPYWRNHHQMNVILAKSRYMPVMSSRACPFNCIYCHSLFGKKVRQKSPHRFVNELKVLYYQYRVREFHIIDDAFNIDRHRLHEILERIINSGMNIRLAFPNALRGDLLEKTDIDLLKAAGAYMLTLAIESASDRIQRLMRKNLNIEKVMDNIAYASSIGLITNGYFMLGFPTESQEELNQSIDLAIHSSLDMVSFHIVVPFPGTKLYQLCKKIYPAPLLSNSGRYQGNSSYYESITGINVLKYQQQAYVRFYTPSRLLRLFSKVPRKAYFLERFFWAGLGVVTAGFRP